MTFIVGFSPDGRWLARSVASEKESIYAFWRVGTWELDQSVETRDRIARTCLSYLPATAG